MNRTPEQWAQVEPRAFLTGSIAQASNVIGMATQDIRDMAARIADLEVALLAATDIAKRQSTKIEELEAERDARPVARWVEAFGCRNLYWGHARIAAIAPGAASCWEASMFSWDDRLHIGRYILRYDFPTPEAAKAAVEEALRGLSAKTEGA